MPRGADALPIRRAFALGIVRALWRGGVIACERAMSVSVARLPTMLCVRSVRATAPEGGCLTGTLVLKKQGKKSLSGRVDD